MVAAPLIFPSHLCILFLKLPDHPAFFEQRLDPLRAAEGDPSVTGEQTDGNQIAASSKVALKRSVQCTFIERIEKKY